MGTLLQRLGKPRYLLARRVAPGWVLLVAVTTWAQAQAPDPELAPRPALAPATADTPGDRVVTVPPEAAPSVRSPARLPHPPGAAHPGGAERVDQQVQGLTRALGLAPDQQAQVRAILLERRRQLLALRSGTSTRPVDVTTATLAIDTQARTAIRQVLDPEQQLKYGTGVPPTGNAPDPADLQHWLELQAGASGGEAAAQPSHYAPDRFSGRAALVYGVTWGIDSLSVRLVESGELVRFSYRVIHPDKAAVLGDRKAEARLEDPQAGVSLVVPTLEKVGQLRQSVTPEGGRSYWMTFSNKGRRVARGDRVDVVVGAFRASNLVVD